AQAGGQVSLHVKWMGDAGGRADVVLGVDRAQGRAMILLIKVQKLVIGARMERIDAQESLVIRYGTHLSAKQIRPAGEQSAVVPSLLIVIVQSQQVVQRLAGGLLARLGAAGNRRQSFLLQPGQNEKLFAMAGPGP